MKFFVTGVGGQLGHDVMNELLKRGYEGVGSDMQEACDTAAPYMSLDITDRNAVEKAITDVNPDAGTVLLKTPYRFLYAAASHRAEFYT